MRALLTACLLGLTGLASAVPDFCGADTRNQGAAQSGRISHLPVRGYGAGKTCYVMNCEVGQALHVRYEAFLIGNSFERFGLPANASLSVTDVSGGVLDFFVGRGPLTSEADAAAVTKEYPTGAVMFLNSTYETLRWPGFAASWRCGADPEPLALPTVPDYVPEECDAVHVVHGGTEVWGFLRGQHCFVIESCGPGYRTAARTDEFELGGQVMSMSLVNTSAADTTATEVERHIESRVPQAWSASYSGDMAVVLRVWVFAVQDSSKGLRVEGRCLPLQVSEPESHTQLYLPECQSQVFAAQSGDELQVIPQAGLGGVKCSIIQCDAGQWVYVSLLRYERGSRSNTVQVLHPDTFDSPRVLWEGVRTLNGSLDGVVVEGRFALVRLTPHSENIATAVLHFVWQCVQPGTTVSPVSTRAPDTPEPVSLATPRPATATPAPASPSTAAPPLREEEKNTEPTTDRV
eukprot:TRINITY_DN400_c0_g1_i1.p1 TRINITY_DN400_c0_g1~~TRINITY_DN400_c0_g1_i1.p1  ORF type:complete len:481 (+),score=119.69 TRINITY_DN400_c0_g1_i1:59-1444(+)